MTTAYEALRLLLEDDDVVALLKAKVAEPGVTYYDCVRCALSEESSMTPAQIAALLALHQRYHCTFVPSDWAPRFDLPEGWVAGVVGANEEWTGIFVGCSPEGDIHS